MIQGAKRGYIDDVIIPQATRPRNARAGDAAREDGGDAGAQAQAHFRMMRDIRLKYFDPSRMPASTMIQVGALSDEKALYEVDVVAVLRRRERDVATGSATRS
jgi:hypothetical protein